MKYLIFPTKEAADKRNMAEALARGCGNAITCYWWSAITHPTDGRVALRIPMEQIGDSIFSVFVGVDDQPYDTEAETAAMVEELSADWFSNEVEA